MMKQPRRIDEIRPGCYRYRVVRGGPWLPARVTIENGMVFIVEADRSLKVGISAETYADLVVDMVMNGKAFDSALLRVLWFGELISESEYDYMLRLIHWAKENHPDHPINHPDRPVKLSAVPVKSVF
jgi:hypothetical protein